MYIKLGIGGIVSHSRRIKVIVVCLLGALALAFAIAGALLFRPPAAAAEGEVSPQVSVVRELTARRTAYGSTYLLSNGAYRTVLAQSPVHFKDASGTWQAIDLTLTRGADGSYVTKAAAVSVELAERADAATPVRLTSNAGSVGLELVGAAASEAIAYGSSALYPGVLSSTDLIYEASGDGVKETLVLGNAAAPSAFRFRLAHEGLTLKQDESGQWGLYAAGAREPAFTLGALTVVDSSTDESGVPASCEGARLVVSPGEGQSSVSYEIPREWMDDPARVWPLVVDPNLFTRNPTDTYIAQGYPGSAYGSSAELLYGSVSSQTQVTKGLVRFPQLDNPANIPAAAHVSAATFSIRQFWQPASPHNRLHVYRLYGTSTNWSDTTTWNGMTITGKDELQPDSLSASGSDWVDVGCPGVVQGWIDGSFVNRGFLLAALSSEDASYARKFRSGEYGDPDYRPKLTVDWEEPTVTPSPAATSYAVGDTVNVTVSVGSVAVPTQISELRVGVNRTRAEDARRGVYGWFADPPTGDAHWVYQAAAQNGGYFAYYNSDATGNDHSAPLLDACTINAAHTVATFAFETGASWADPVDPDPSQLDTYLEMSAGSRTWSSGWVAQSAASFSVNQAAGVPAPLACLTSTTTATSAWYVGSLPNDGTSAGRGSVTLSWPAVPLADSYTVKLWDGVKYDTVATTTATTWTTPTNLFPTDTAIAAIAPGYTGNPFSTYGSRELRDNPNALYAKMAGASNTDTDYRFKVIPHNAVAGDAPESECAPLRVTLDNRSVVVTGDASAEDPRHVTCDLGEWDAHALAAELDSGVLTSSTTDLAITSWGPPAALSRSYRSNQSTAGLFAPGWFFAFEQSLAITPTLITYTDAGRLPHRFAGSGSLWSAPNGFLATLAPSGSNWRLTFTDQSCLTFDAAGRLTAESDAHGNTTTYTWTAGQVTQIGAANGQAITLSYSGAKLSSASYATAAGTRTITYTTTAPWRATLYPGSAVQRQLSYGYDATPRLTSLTQQDWPTSGQSVAATIIYSAGKVTELRYADYHATNKPDARATITYDSATQATVCHYGSVAGAANLPMNQEVYLWSAAAAGVPNQLASRTTGTGALALTETYNYAFDRQAATTTSSDGGQSNETFNTAHDLTSATTTTGSLAADNQTTSYAYDTLHRVTAETSYQSPLVFATTTNTYTGADLVAVQTSDQAGILLSASTYTYDAQGRTTQEKQLVSGTLASGTWTQTDTSNFAACGEPQTTIARSIKLSPTANPQDLTKTAGYDAFGNLLTETDWSNARVTATNTYDIAGNLLTATDAASVVTHTTYDCMGNATESWKTAPGTSVKADWSLTSYDAIGRALTVTTKLSDANGNPTTQSVVTSTYDGAGNELTSDETTTGGHIGATLYDASANATQSWAEGAYNDSEAARTTRSLYDAEGNLTCESLPGNATTPTPSPTPGASLSATTYDDAGNLLTQSEPDGTLTLHAYDGQGSETASAGEATSTADFLPWQEESEFDAAGQATENIDAQDNHTGLTTAATFDKLGRTLSETAQRDSGSEPATTTTYNDLSWVLSSVDANGVTTANTYDTHGALTSVTVGTKTTTSSYNATTGRLETVTDADGTTLTYTYDAFGRVTRELHQTSGGATLKDVGGTNGRTLDSLGRTTSESEAVTAVTHGWSYPVNTASGLQETLAYDATPLTSLAITRNGRGVETSRTATIAASTTATLAVADSSSGRDAADRWIQRTIQRSGYTAKTQYRSFDAAGRLASQSGLGFSAAGSYTYDANSGRKTSESLPLLLGGAIADTFSYFAGGRLAEATTNGVEESFSFDEAGNLTLDAVTDVAETKLFYDAANRLTSSSYTLALDGATAATTYYGWDETNGQRVWQGPSPTPSPSVSPTNEPVAYSYNAQGRMASYANADSATSASYTYDAAGQRTKSVVTVGATTTTTSFAYEGLTLLKLSATQGATTWRLDYLCDEDGRPWAGVHRSPAASTSPTFFSVVKSARGDVVELLDANGSAFAAYRYDAWGSPQGAGSYATGIWTQATSLVSSTLAGQIASRQILRYAGYAFDAESGLYYCSARYYDPATRQWTTGDPAKADGEESAYQYCVGNPVGGIDPSGRKVRCNTVTHTQSVASEEGGTTTMKMIGKVYYKWHSTIKWEIVKVTGVIKGYDFGIDTGYFLFKVRTSSGKPGTPTVAMSGLRDYNMWTNVLYTWVPNRPVYTFRDKGPYLTGQDSPLPRMTWAAYRWRPTHGVMKRVLGGTF